ncbi:hypothetical protein ACFSTE_20920 [Aquimarina hainanensis]|uniref:Uncharacterized protein n=1 Tax=Aquimarina hainanensis TaxID=1578017 RepID=A0ABW5NER8_9FLAO
MGNKDAHCLLTILPNYGAKKVKGYTSMFLRIQNKITMIPMIKGVLGWCI